VVFKIKFGTDGWRGVVAEDYTFDNVRRAAQGFASYMLTQGKAGQWVVVGHDKRFGSENFAAATTEVLVGNGLKVYLTDGATPTPAIAFSVVNKKAAGAVNITASHNPPSDNGFKVRNETGGAIAREGLKQIEAGIPDLFEDIKRVAYSVAEKQGLIVKFDPAPAYIEHIEKLIDLQPIKAAGLTVMVDTMWGNGAGWFPRLIGGGKTKVFEIHNVRNPSFPEMKRPEPVPPNIDVGLRAILDNHADVLFAIDGDADRLGIGDEKGHFVDQLRIFGLMVLYLLEQRGLRGPIVKTIPTTTMLNKLGKIYSVPVYETGVGFKYIAPKMIETNALIGGDENGGYAFHGHVPECDGILAGLYFLDFMVRTGKKTTELLQMLFDKVGEHCYGRIDSPFSGKRAVREKIILDAKPVTLGGVKVIGMDTIDGFRFKLEDGGWLLIRFSGTEPILRIYCETMRGDMVQAILQDGLKVAGIT
jgi:phosphomannomutase